jgi:hypothetical protein
MISLGSTWAQVEINFPVGHCIEILNEIWRDKNPNCAKVAVVRESHKLFLSLTGEFA